MVRLDLYRQHVPPVWVSDVPKDALQMCRDRADQRPSAIFRDPHQMVRGLEDRSGRGLHCEHAHNIARPGPVP